MAHTPYPAFACNAAYDYNVPCVTMTWEGYATSRAFREENERIVDIIAAHKAPKMLADVKDFVLIGTEDQNWLVRTWIPRAVDAGMRTVAIVRSIYHFNRVAVENVADNLDADSVAVSFFDDRAAALAWLRAQ